ncbi:hypothetical protein SAMN05216464_101446 [Mucilaginibacter pineti]|uniref:Uncharacterized protein n=1 Tax=Mucilaginibacter pineti TaxID=1391627 RepID=A0A1G6TX39_9SPHI|nr:hypothetical protein [Mucilaginibacter pineti]SDD33484.1 hypothetical protein SAMN05216464_101446 [Mucilaginibacter pineti]
MKYYFKFDKHLVALPFLLFVYGFIQTANFFNKHLAVLSWSFFLGLACIVLLIIYTFRNFNMVRLAILRRSLLEITEEYIHHHVYNVKYYWSDIDEIEPADNTIYIKMYDKAISPVKDKNALIRYFVYAKKNNMYTIDLTYVKGSHNKLFSLLNDYSIPSLELEGK